MKSPTSPELLYAFAEGAFVGTAIAPLSAEILAHRQAHRTDELVSPVKELAELAFWGLGSDPDTFSLEHRVHHRFEAEYPGGSMQDAVNGVLQDSFVSRSRAEAIVKNKSLRRAIVFDGLDPANDPILECDEQGIPVGLKRTIVSEFITKLPEPLSNLVVPSLIIATQYRRYKEKYPDAAMQHALTWYTGYFLASTASALVPGIPEHKRGGIGRTLGRDIGSKALHLVIPSPSVRHKAHHKAPHERQAPGSPWFSIDILYARALDKLKLLKQDRTQL